MTKRDIRFFGLAKNASEMSDFCKQHIGCVVVHKGNIISAGWNMQRSSPIQAHYNRYRNLYGENVEHKVHAEISALSKIKYLDIDFSKCSIYVYREHKNGTRACAKPHPPATNC